MLKNISENSSYEAKSLLIVSYERLRDLLGLPKATRIVAVSDRGFFASSRLAIKIEDHGLCPAEEDKQMS